MTGFFSPQYSVGSSWKSTLQVAFSQLMRTHFATDNSFNWVNFDPKLTYSGTMTGTANSANQTRYLKLSKLLFFSFDISMTLVAPLSNQIFVTLPGTTRASTLGQGYQAGGCQINNAVTNEVGFWNIAPGENRLAVTRPAAVNYTAVATRIICNGVIEIA